MKLITLIIAMLTTTSLMAQTVINDKNAQTRQLSGFHAIKVSNGIDLYLTNGNEAVAVSASEQKYADRIKTIVENGVLKIWYENDGPNIVWTDKKNLRAYVSVKQLDMLSGSGGSDIKVDGTLKGNSLSLSMSGGSDFSGKIQVTDLKVDQSGGADIDISGSTDKLDIQASGGSDFNGKDFVADYCTVEASGGSDVDVTVNKEMSARASGASDIRYRGNATLKESHSSGAGSVSKKG